MIADIKSYPAMKDSGVPWLGEVPEHWRLLRTKTLLRERVQKGFPDEPLLAATQTKGVVRKDQYENRTVLALKDLHLLKLVRAGDFVISLRSFQGGIEYAREQGIISPAYTVLYPAQPRAHGYLARLFKSKPYVENLSLYVTGIRQGQNIDYEKLSRSQLPVPPIPEQAAIVRFLDHADRRIRRYIAAKQKLIKLLEEQKQAIIHRAVTRGLDPNVHLKPSGVPWFGDV
jgi:type I restriction enzyme, S subunit